MGTHNVSAYSNLIGGARLEELDDEAQAAPQTQFLLMMANVESLNTQLEQVLGYEVHDNYPSAIFVNEHRLTQQRQQQLQAQLRDEGIAIHCTPAATGTTRKAGGVAVLTRPGTRFVPESNNDMEPWITKGRMMAGRLHDTHNRLLCYVLVLYGVPDPSHNQQESTELLAAAEAYIAPRRRQPLAVVGDFNVNVWECPRTLQWLTSGLLIDALHLCHGQRRPTHTQGGCLDHILISERLVARLGGAEQDRDRIFPTHDILHMTLQRAPATEHLLRFYCDKYSLFQST